VFDLQNSDDIVGLTFTGNSVFAPVQVLHNGDLIVDFEIVDNYFENPNDYAVTFWVTPTVTVGTLGLGFESNTVIAPSGLLLVDGPVQDSVATLSGVSIRDNAFTGGFEPVGFTNVPGYVTLIGGGENIYIVNNLMDGGSVPGLYLRSWFTPEAAADHPFRNLYIESNTIQNLDGTDAVVFEKYYGDSTAVSQSLAPTGPGVLSIRNNSLVNNGGVGIQLVPPDVGPHTIDARWNWWGDPLGPNGPSGDGVGAGVIFDPWLGSITATNKLYLPVVSK
jgi:hypothetical protein